MHVLPRARGFGAKAYEQNREAKHALVRQGRAHGTLVYCAGEPVGWCQFGPGAELGRVDRKRGRAPTAEDPWRITRLFIAPGNRRAGLARLAVNESVEATKLNAEAEAYPVEGVQRDPPLGRHPRALPGGGGFSRVRPLGRKSWIYSLAPQGGRTR